MVRFVFKCIPNELAWVNCGEEKLAEMMLGEKPFRNQTY